MNGNAIHTCSTTALTPEPARASSRALAMALGLAIAFVVGCASTPPLTPSLERPGSLPHGASPQTVRSTVVDTTREMLGTRYRYGGGSPEEGFDCSGLVVYSYRRAGVHGLPRSARDLERQATPISMDALQPGDLLFFRLGGIKTTHVGVYEGDRHFIHAPSSGKGVERVGFDHVYWGPRIGRAGRLVP